MSVGFPNVSGWTPNVSVGFSGWTPNVSVGFPNFSAWSPNVSVGVPNVSVWSPHLSVDAPNVSVDPQILHRKLLECENFNILQSNCIISSRASPMPQKRMSGHECLDQGGYEIMIVMGQQKRHLAFIHFMNLGVFSFLF